MNKISREALLGMARVAGIDVHPLKQQARIGIDTITGDDSTAKLERFAELVLAAQQPVEWVPASAYRDAADTIEQIKWNSQHCECHAFEIANGWINETNGGTMFDDPSQQQSEPVAWQFFQDGKWWNGSEDIKDHRKNTENAGIPTRDLYPPPAVATRAAIRRVFIAHGFTVKEGHNDLKPYVFEAAGALLRELSPAVAIPAGYKLVEC